MTQDADTAALIPGVRFTARMAGNRRRFLYEVQRFTSPGGAVFPVACRVKQAKDIGEYLGRDFVVTPNTFYDVQLIDGIE